MVKAQTKPLGVRKVPCMAPPPRGKRGRMRGGGAEHELSEGIVTAWPGQTFRLFAAWSRFENGSPTMNLYRK